MQKAEVVLGVLRERGRQGLPLTQLYRQMFNGELYLLAYGNIYSNQGAMTPGASEETADGMSEDKIDQITGLMRGERYRFSPARRVYIPKKNGKLRPLGLPSWSDKLVGEVVRLLLEAYYEPVFSDRSHGFRKGRGCHTALREINDTWTGTTWFIEGDISDCLGSLDHEILLGILAEKIHDQRSLRLIRNMLKAGYLEDWEYRDCPAPPAAAMSAGPATPAERAAGRRYSRSGRFQSAPRTCSARKACTVEYQALTLPGDSTQWFSSGKYRNLCGIAPSAELKRSASSAHSRSASPIGTR
jgi:hypothetical protein